MATSIVGNSDLAEVLRGSIVRDEYNSDVVNWDNPTVVAVGRASIQFFMTTEDDTDRQTTSSGLRLISDDPKLMNVIRATDRIRSVGVVYEVDAQAQDWRNFGKSHHVEVYLKKVVG